MCFFLMLDYGWYIILGILEGVVVFSRLLMIWYVIYRLRKFVLFLLICKEKNKKKFFFFLFLVVKKFKVFL